MTVSPAHRASLWAVFLGLLVGCGPEPIRSYEVPKPPPEAEPEKPTEVRLLGAIIPTGPNQSRFIKFTGPADRIEPFVNEFDSFVASIQLTGDPKKPVTYTPPPSAKPGPQKQFRLATFLLGDGEKPLELYISDPFGGTLLENVNRWRGEVGLKPITEAELPKETTEVRLGDVKAYKVDFRGPGSKGGRMPPFMGQ